MENTYKSQDNANYTDVDRTEAQNVSEEELYHFLVDGKLNLGDAE